MLINYAGPARSFEELSVALDLASLNFKLDTQTYDECREYLKLRILSYPGFRLENCIVVLGDNHKLIGSAFLFESQYNFDDHHINLSNCFLTYVSIAGEFRGFNISRILVESALTEAANLSTLSTVVARRAVNWYYTKFGFRGISHYASFDVMLETQRNDGILSNYGYSFEDAIESDLSILKTLYQNEYINHLGSLCRSKALWKYYLTLLNSKSLSLKIIYQNNITIGYICFDSCNRVVELAFGHQLALHEFKSIFKCLFPGMRTISFDIPPLHSIIQGLYGIDIVMRLRQCPYGGHMVKTFASNSSDNITLENELPSFELMPNIKIPSFTSILGNSFDLSTSFNIPFLDQI